MNKYQSAISLPAYETSTPTFGDAYGMYTESRNALHAAEFADAAPEQVAKLFSDTLALKEDLAYHALRKYKQAGSPSVFISDIKGELETHPAAQEDALRAAVNDTFIGAYILPLSTREDTPSPIESIAASARNLEIAGAYIAAAQDSDVAMLLSGSSAWATFREVQLAVQLKSRESQRFC